MNAILYSSIKISNKKSIYRKPLCAAASASAIQDKWGGGSFFWKIMVALHFSHGLYKPPSVEHRFLPFNTCDARVGKISFPVVFLLRILWQRRRTYNLFTSKKNASKCHKASHEDYSWLKNQLTMILNVCWNWCHPLKHLLIKCCCKPSFSKPVHFAPLCKDCEICICKQALCIFWSLKSKDFKIPLLYLLTL